MSHHGSTDETKARKKLTEKQKNRNRPVDTVRESRSLLRKLTALLVSKQQEKKLQIRPTEDLVLDVQEDLPEPARLVGCKFDSSVEN